MAASKTIHPEAEIDGGLGGVSTALIYRELLRRLGEDPSRNGLLATPGRVEKSMAFLTKGYNEEPSKVLNGAIFGEKYDEMVIVKDIEFSACASIICCRSSAALMWRTSRTERSSG